MRPDLGANEEQATRRRPEVRVSRPRPREVPVAAPHHLLADIDLALENEAMLFLGVRVHRYTCARLHAYQVAHCVRRRVLMEHLDLDSRSEIPPNAFMSPHRHHAGRGCRSDTLQNTRAHPLAFRCAEIDRRNAVRESVREIRIEHGSRVHGTARCSSTMPSQSRAPDQSEPPSATPAGRISEAPRFNQASQTPRSRGSDLPAVPAAR